MESYLSQWWAPESLLHASCQPAKHKGERQLILCPASSVSQLPGFAQPRISRQCLAKVSAHSNTRASAFRTQHPPLEVEGLLTLSSQQQGPQGAYKKGFETLPRRQLARNPSLDSDEQRVDELAAHGLHSLETLKG